LIGFTQGVALGYYLSGLQPELHFEKIADAELTSY